MAKYEKITCTGCGAPIHLDDIECPYCGRTNDQAKQHRREIDKQKREYERRQSRLLQILGNYKGITIRLIALIAAIILMIVSYSLEHGVYSFHRKKMAKEAKNNSAGVVKTIDNYIENRDYVSLAAYAEYHGLTGYILTDDKVFGKYYPILLIARDYENLYYDVMQVCADEDPLDKEYKRTRINEDLSYFYNHIYNPDDSYMFDYGDPELVREVIGDAGEMADALFITYLGFTEEEMDSMHSLSEARRSVIIEDKIIDLAGGTGGDSDE